MTLSLSTPVVLEVLRCAQPHYRRFLEQAIAAGEEVRICSLVLQQLAHAALESDAPEPHLSQLDALIAHLQVEPFTGEDALSAARVQSEWRRTVLSSPKLAPLGVLDVLTAGQALNRGWTLVADKLGRGAPGVRTVLWGDPAGPVDLAAQAESFQRAGSR
ncbi:MAG TPA: PIN domain-containing protein [Phenylobacterium sp.]